MWITRDENNPDIVLWIVKPELHSNNKFYSPKGYSPGMMVVPQDERLSSITFEESPVEVIIVPKL